MIMAEDNKSKEEPHLCKGCDQWQVFGGKCWFYWDGKKECTQSTSGYRDIREHFEIDKLFLNRK